MAKILDLNKTVYELTEEYPEIIEIMAGLGFPEIVKEELRQSAGRVMTIPKGAGIKDIPLEKIISAFTGAGFEVVGQQASVEKFEDVKSEESKNEEESLTTANAENAADTENTESAEKTGKTVGSSAPESRIEQLKGYLRRLSGGEELEDVRKDFVKEFEAVEASEIMRAEQEMMKEGTPLTEVQRLCDLHSALFHGATMKEKLINAEKAVAESVERLKNSGKTKEDYANKKEKAAALELIKGHPLYTFTKENDALTKLLAEFNKIRSEKGDISEVFEKIRELSIHYAKKGDLLYPHLKVKYEISGPSAVMWTVDDEIRDAVSALAKQSIRDDEWYAKLDEVIKRADEMIYKEQNILFPICAVNFTDDEWIGIYRDSKDYAQCFGVENELWEEAEAGQQTVSQGHEGEIVMPGGHMNVEQLTALLNTIPIEITFVDSDNINRYFNEGPKVFKRPGMAIDRDVFSCHPPKIEPMVRGIIEDFRAGKRDEVPIWMDKGGKVMLVKYMAVRDKNGKYLGTAEFVQDMEFAKEHFESKNR